MLPTWQGPRGSPGRGWALALGLVLLVARSHFKTYNSVAGPFRIMPRHLEHCPAELEAAEPVTFHVRGWRDRQDLDLWYYSANFTTRFLWTDDQNIDMNMASWSSRGGWKDNYYVIRLNHYCTAFKMHCPEMYNRIMFSLHNRTDVQCRFPPGDYKTHRNVTTNFNIKSVPTFFYGKWRLTLRLLNNTSAKETLACIRMYVDTVPK